MNTDGLKRAPNEVVIPLGPTETALRELAASTTNLGRAMVAATVSAGAAAKSFNRFGAVARLISIEKEIVEIDDMLESSRWFWSVSYWLTSRNNLIIRKELLKMERTDIRNGKYR